MESLCEGIRQRMILKWVKEGVILDLGSQGENLTQVYNGLSLHEFLNKKLIKSELFGIDIIPGKNTNLLFNFNNFNYPIKENSIDTIVAAEVIEHLSMPFKFLQECYRILKPKGRLIITTPNMFSACYLFPIFKPSGTEFDHCYAWNMELFESLVSRTKFKIKYKKNYNYFDSNYFIKLFIKMFPLLKTNIIFVLDKI